MATAPINVKIVIDRSHLDEVLVDLERALAMKQELTVDLRSEVAELKAQLESTEKAYDKALQDNLRLADTLRVEQVGPYAARVERMQDQRQKFHVDTSSICSSTDYEGVYKKMREQEARVPEIKPTHPSLDLMSTEAYEEILSLNVPSRPEMGGAPVIDDSDFTHEAATFEEALHWFQAFGPQEADPACAPGSMPQVISGLRRINQDVNRRHREAQGDRAKMKDTLQRSQNANRKYKARLAQQKPQLEALQELANAAFPLYEALNEGMPFLGFPEKLVKLCEDFHNKFNEAAEALSHE